MSENSFILCQKYDLFIYNEKIKKKVGSKDKIIAEINDHIKAGTPIPIELMATYNAISDNRYDKIIKYIEGFEKHEGHDKKELFNEQMESLKNGHAFYYHSLHSDDGDYIKTVKLLLKELQ